MGRPPHGAGMVRCGGNDVHLAAGGATRGIETRNRTKNDLCAV
jgi:hypothetical protein